MKNQVPIMIDITVLLFAVAIIIVLITGIFVYVVSLRTRHHMNIVLKAQKEEITEYVTKYNNEVINSIKEILKNNMANVVSTAINKPEPDLYNIFEKIRTSIKDNAVKYMDKLKANRLAIYLFHNGTKSTHGVKFFKMSCVGECIARGSGIRDKMIEHSAINLNLLDDTVSEIIDVGTYIVISDDDVEDMRQRLFVSSHSIKYSIIASIYDDKNNVLGLVCAEIAREYIRDVANQEKTLLKEFSEQVAPVLMYCDYRDAAADHVTGAIKE
jgi:hypothetical protein